MSDSVEIPALPDLLLPAERWRTRLFTRVGTAVDATLLRGMQMVVDAVLMPKPESLPWLLASAAGVLDPALQREPKRFFAFHEPDAVPKMVEKRFVRALSGGAAMACELTIDYRPHGLEADGAPEIEERILLEHWVHEPGRPRGTIVALHGFMMGRPRLDAVVLFAGHWFQRGLDVVLLTLPHHGARTPADSRFSGERFAVPHVARLSEAVRQAVFEIRTVTSWLSETTAAPVGLLGLSLGGYLTSLMAGLYDDLDFVIPMVPPACIGDLAWQFFMRSRHHQEGLPPTFSHDELRSLYWIHSPLAHPLQVPRHRVLIIAGRGDRIVPPEHPNALWHHWGKPDIHWFSGSHLAPFGRGRIINEVVRHLEQLGIL